MSLVTSSVTSSGYELKLKKNSKINYLFKKYVNVVLDLVFCLWKIDEIMIIKMEGNTIREIQQKYDFICQTHWLRLRGHNWCLNITVTSVVGAHSNANLKKREI